MTRLALLPVLSSLLLLGLACEDATTEPALEGCSGPGPTCAMGTPGGRCGDVVVPPTCQSGVWACVGTGVIPADECDTVGLPPPGRRQRRLPDRSRLPGDVEVPLPGPRVRSARPLRADVSGPRRLLRLQPPLRVRRADLRGLRGPALSLARRVRSGGGSRD